MNDGGLHALVRSRRRRSRAPQSGQAGAEVLLGGVVLLIGLGLMLANIWIVLDAKTAASSMARVGAQTFIEQDSFEAGQTALHGTISSTLDQRFPRRWRVDAALGSFVRCAPVSVTVAIEVPLVAVPFLGSIGGSKTITSTHRTRIDPYRSRVPGEADCG